MEYGTLFLSKVITEDRVSALRKYNITVEDMPTEAEREAYKFVMKYAETNAGHAPSYATMAVESDLLVVPDVSDSFEYMATRIKEHTALMRMASMFFNGSKSTAQPYLEQMDGISALDKIISDLERLKKEVRITEDIGTDIKTDKAKYLVELDKRKKGESFKVWRSAFSFINKASGGYTSSNVYVIYGKSGRGKSVVTLREACEFAKQGARVLVWSLEMATYEVMTRIYSMVSAMEGVAVANVDGVDMASGFNQNDLRNGRISGDYEAAFREFLENLDDILDGTIIVRGVDDNNFIDRSLAMLEADIEETKPDVVIIDPFYYMDYERNTSRTTGGDAAATSKALRRLAGKLGVCILAITQADETIEEATDDGSRALKLPDRKDVSKTKQLLQDAALLIGVDTDYKQGRGLIGINKGRDGGEGTDTEVLYLPQYGVVQEYDDGYQSAKEFGFI